MLLMKKLRHIDLLIYQLDKFIYDIVTNGPNHANNKNVFMTEEFLILQIQYP